MPIEEKTYWARYSDRLPSCKLVASDPTDAPRCFGRFLVAVFWVRDVALGFIITQLIPILATTRRPTYSSREPFVEGSIADAVTPKQQFMNYMIRRHHQPASPLDDKRAICLGGHTTGARCRVPCRIAGRLFSMRCTIIQDAGFWWRVS